LSAHADVSPAAAAAGGLRAEPVAYEQFKAGQQLYAFGGGRLEAGAFLAVVLPLLCEILVD